jgi:hypothetical protein
MKQTWMIVITAACLAVTAGAAPGKEQRISDPNGAPIKIPMTRGQVVKALAEYSKRFVDERGGAAAEDVFRRFDASAGKAVSRKLPPPDQRASWLANTPGDGIGQGYCGNPGLMDANAYALFVDQYGIEFHYVVNGDGAEGDVLQCADLAEVIAQLLNYSDEILEYLGNATPEMKIYLFAPGVSAGCGLADACAGGGPIYLSDGDADATVHETAHALQHIAINNNQNDPANPLKGRKAEFDAVFAIPPEYAGLVTYTDFYGPDGVVHLSGPLEETPPGFIDQYAMINDWENFAMTCQRYVQSPDRYLALAHTQAWDEHIELCLKYRFAYRRVFLYKDFTNLFAPQTAIVSLRPVDKGDGDGRVEPGEYFALDLSIVPLDDYPAATHLRCLPHEVSTTVVCVATSEFTSGLAKGVRYDFPQAFDYRLPSSFQGETDRTFMLSYYSTGGALATLGWDFVPLNEKGYLWGWVNDGGEEKSIVRLTSTMKEVEEVLLPAELTELLEGLEHLLYDPEGDCFWMGQLWSDGSIYRIPRGAPAMYEVYPLDPADELAGGETYSMALSPVDGSLWFITDESELVRLLIGENGVVNSQIYYPWELSTVPWNGTVALAMDGASGKLWLASSTALMRLSPVGALEMNAGGFTGITALATAPDGGCWIVAGTSLSQTLKKISPAGAVQFTKIPTVKISSIACNPSNGALWAIGSGECYSDKKLVVYSASGSLLSTRDVDSSSASIIPCTSDATAFLRVPFAQWGARRYQTYGGPLYTTILNLQDYAPFSYYQALP